MLLVALVGQVLRLKRRLFDSVWFLRLCQWVAPLGFFAVLAGWITTEVGRQPWTVYGLLRTSNSVSPSLTGTDVVVSLALYFVVYLIMFATGIAFMAGLVRRGPQDSPLDPEVVESGRSNRPFRDAARAGVDT
jgi:cytochrome d ubiquinol oxidase subunit I